MNAYSLYNSHAQDLDTNVLSRDDILSAGAAATGRVAPYWPLKNFVAVNPYMGVIDRSFGEADAWLEHVAGSQLIQNRDFYADAMKSGRMTTQDIAAAIDQSGSNLSEAVVRLSLSVEKSQAPRAMTIAGLLDDDLERFLVERISRWAAGYFDIGQSSWKQTTELDTFSAWKSFCLADFGLNIAGLKGLRGMVRELPDDASDAVAAMVQDLDLSKEDMGLYFDRLLMSISGWASYARYHSWQDGLKGTEQDHVLPILAIRLAFEWALLKTVAESRQAELIDALNRSYLEESPFDRTADHILHLAYEIAWQRELIGKLNAHKSVQASPERAPLQAVFCIDVRSEVYRRSLEHALPGAETFGFAGFFGVPLEYVPLGDKTEGDALCPVLLSPAYRIAETTEASEQVLRRKTVLSGFRKAWNTLKHGSVSTFAFVDSFGLAYGFKLVTDSLGITRPASNPDGRGVGAASAARLEPSIDATDGAAGIPLAERVDLARNVLAGMSLQNDFSRLVFLIGHGSESANNPHASGLDCGACGGNPGGANARTAVMLLNDAPVRKGLAEAGVVVPDDTVFVAGLHNTTTDDVTIFDKDSIPESHSADLRKAAKAFRAAGITSRAERSGTLTAPVGPGQRQIKRRRNDWSQVRPEWGLAGCAAFVAAPRSHTQGLNLGGRVFLHSYDPASDPSKGVLELIMTAPMVVASWINLQYYASVVDNQRFGCGEKTLHNVVGKVGVLEGNGGDLRTGLAWQSIHNGEKLMHEPLRLNVVLQAETADISDVIAKHDMVRHLADNKWIHLFAMNNDGQISSRYAGKGNWEPVDQ